jgi:phosphotransferase system enzyme I (PtsI)
MRQSVRPACSIRLALSIPDVSHVQLRAIFAASVTGNICMRFLSARCSSSTKMVLQRGARTGRGRTPFDRDMKVGMMVRSRRRSMPDHFAHEGDFFSIGANDSIQYALAVDRSNKDVAALHGVRPVVLRLINMAVKTGNEHNVPISMCGQMCGNPLYTMLLLGMGLWNMSDTGGDSEITGLPRVECELRASGEARSNWKRRIKTFLKELELPKGCFADRTSG